MRGLLFPLIGGLMLLVTAHAQKPTNLLRREVPFGTPVNLQEFGGTNIDVAVRDRQPSAIYITLADYTQQIAVARTSIDGVAITGNTATVYGRNGVILNPVRTSKAVPKENGFSPDGRMSEAYLIHKDPSGVRVFFYDTLDVKQNHCVLLIGPAPVPPEPAAPSGAAERLQELERLKASGLITDQEYQEKRREILSGL